MTTASRQRMSTKLGEYVMAPLRIEELEELLRSGGAMLSMGLHSGSTYVVEAKLREAAWTLEDLSKETGLTVKQVHNAMTSMRGRGVKPEKFFISGRNATVYVVRDSA